MPFCHFSFRPLYDLSYDLSCHLSFHLSDHLSDHLSFRLSIFNSPDDLIISDDISTLFLFLLCFFLRFCSISTWASNLYFTSFFSSSS